MVSSSASDVQWLIASRVSPQMFGEIVSRYQTEIFRYVSRRAGSRDAADITAEVFARAFESRYKFDPMRGSARPWLYGIASHVIVDHLRRTEVRNRTPGVWAVDTDPFDSVLDAVVAQSARPRITAALARLTPEDRETLLLVVLADLTGPEAAEALGIPIGTVKSRLSRAKSQMRRSLGKDLKVEL